MNVGLLPWVLPLVVKQAAAYLFFVLDCMSYASISLNLMSKQKNEVHGGSELILFTVVCQEVDVFHLSAQQQPTAVGPALEPILREHIQGEKCSCYSSIQIKGSLNEL